jgi:transposase
MDGPLPFGLYILEVFMSKIVLGIDVSKAKLDLALLLDAQISHFVVQNSAKGFAEILDIIASKTTEKPEIYMEATGCYCENVADFLVDQGFDVKIVNPAKIHAFAKAKISKAKTDKADAKLIADYGAKFEEKSYEKLSPEAKQLRDLYRCSAAQSRLSSAKRT